ncbi:MAG: MMPL family transporter [SAR86 cluster bacterium]|nr:MMPL family transporter [SAR86 cluster bacterium]
MPNKILNSFAAVISQKPIVVLALGLILLLISAFNIPNFKLEASSDSLVLENDEDLRYYREISNEYSTGDFLVVLFTPKEPLFSIESIKNVRNLSDRFEELDGVGDVLSYLDAPLLFSPKMSMSELADNLKTIEEEGVDLNLAKREFQDSPLYTELLVSKDGKTTALQLNLIESEEYDAAIQKRYQLRQKLVDGGEENIEEQIIQVNSLISTLNNQEAKDRDKLIKEVRDILSDSSEFGSLYLGGTAMIASDMMSFVKSDLNYFGVGVFVIFILTLGIVFRRLRWVVLPLSCSAVVGLFVVGFLGLVDWRVTVVSSNFIALLLIISISLSIHIIVRYQEIAGREQSLNQNELVSLTIQEMFRPCLYTALTTMVAFASLSISDIKPVIEFGKMMVMGILFAFIFTFTVLPSIMALINKLSSDSEKDFSKGLTLHLASYTSKNGKVVVVLSSLLLIVSLIGITKLTVENRFIDYFKESTEIYQGMELLDLKLGGTAPLDIVLESPQDYVQEASDFDDDFEDDFGFDETSSNGYWWNIINIKRLEAVHDYMDSLPEVGKVLSVASGIKVAEELKDGEPISELDLALVKNLLPEDIKETLLSSYISEDENQVRISSRVLETSKTLKRNDLLKEIENTLEDEFGFKKGEYRLTGLAVLYNNMLQSLFSSQIGTLGVVFVVIMIMFVVLFRSFYLAVIGMIPNLLAASVVLGTMGWMKVPLDIMTITVAAISVGMAVDNTIHYIHRFKLEFKKTSSYENSMKNSHNTIGRAMFYTSTTIIIGFLVLVTSNFNPTVYFGLFVSLAMFMALLGALTLLPQLLMILKPLGKEES